MSVTVRELRWDAQIGSDMRSDILPIMWRPFLAVLVLVLALTVGALATFAKSNSGKVDNVAATRTYLLARHRLMLAGQHDQQAGVEAVRSLVASVKSECPGVLAGAPENRARDDIRAEIVDGVPLTLERPARNATIIFAMAVQRLRWSNRKLTYYVSHSAREEAAQANLALPDICADARALAVSGFKAAPATTDGFLRSYDTATTITTIEIRPGETGDLEERIWRLLKPYERPDEKALIPHKPTKQQLEQTGTAIEKEIGEPVVEIAHALGLPD
jgi:hypothetical protein